MKKNEALLYTRVEVFIVVVVIERILAAREKQNMMKKLNMVVGGFLANWEPA
jgi:hypothetical protein